MVVPMPTATPPTAATTGFRAVRIAARKLAAGEATPSPRLAERKSARSFPAVKQSAWPCRKITWTDGSASARSKAADMASYISPVSAFLFSGRWISISATRSAMDVLTFSDIRLPP
jgi:hypothetical protein